MIYSKLQEILFMSAFPYTPMQVISYSSGDLAITFPKFSFFSPYNIIEFKF